MKKRLLVLAFLSLCLVLSACGSKNNTIYGEVVEATPTALVLETSEGERVAVLLEEDTYIWGMDDIDGYAYKAAPHTGVRVYFFPEGRAGSITTADGEQVNAYHHTDSYIRIDAYLLPETAVLSDGTQLDAWKTSAFNITYQTKDGVVLLREEPPNGPKNHHVANRESFYDLSEAAKPHVTEFYEKQGALYDLQSELERAWTAYQADPDAFSSFVVGQRSFPAASSERVFYFGTMLTRTAGGNIASERDVSSGLTQTVIGNVVQETTLCAAFDRETGASIPFADLFVCPAEDVGKKLLALAEKNGTGPADPVLKAEMEAAFRMEYLNFSPDSLWVEFPQGTLPSQEYPYFVSVAFNDESKALLHPWAVPYHSTQ